MAVDRGTPTVGPKSGQGLADEINEEVVALWKRVAVEVNTIGGTANAITGTADPTLDAYVKGMFFWFIPTGMNTDPATINIDARGAKPIVNPDNTALSGGEFQVGRAALLLYDGTSMRIMSSVGSGLTLGVYKPGRPVNGYFFLRYEAEQIVFIPAEFVGSRASATDAATATATFNILHNGVQVGTLEFAASALDGVFDMDDDLALAVGDILEIESPDPQDATLQNVTISIKAYR